MLLVEGMVVAMSQSWACLDRSHTEWMDWMGNIVFQDIRLLK